MHFLELIKRVLRNKMRNLQNLLSSKSKKNVHYRYLQATVINFLEIICYVTDCKKRGKENSNGPAFWRQLNVTATWQRPRP